VTIAPGPLETYAVCDVPIAAVTPDRAAALIVEHAVAKGSYEVHLCNAYTLSLVAADALLADALSAGDLNLPDGAPVAWLGRRRGTHGPVRGPGLVTEVARLGVPHGVRHYLYGGAEGVADQVQAALEQRVPDVSVVAAECPPWTDLDDRGLQDLAARIARSGADLVWIGLGTPRQDYLVRRLAPLVAGPVVPVGAAFDFLAGRVNEAPAALQGSGLEWLHRLSKEPRRLWRRYLLGNPRFVVHAMRARRRA
jgi:N-acetylglucosaminyldiphosphoundecaprenol N-acetyl-beta-D-mannosaminyltransferase